MSLAVSLAMWKRQPDQIERAQLALRRLEEAHDRIRQMRREDHDR